MIVDPSGEYLALLLGVALLAAAVIARIIDRKKNRP